jgi:hypothetical protein
MSIAFFHNNKEVVDQAFSNKMDIHLLFYEPKTK